MTIQKALLVVYLIGAAISFIIALVNLAYEHFSEKARREWWIYFLFLFFAMVSWPYTFYRVLDLLQGELGIFWKSKEWRPRSLRILEVLHSSGREMFAYEIYRECQKKISQRKIEHLLELLADSGEVKMHEAPESELKRLRELQTKNGERARFEIWRYSITPKGRRYRDKRLSGRTKISFGGLPQPA